jgi:hypothetical protein
LNVAKSGGSFFLSASSSNIILPSASVGILRIVELISRLKLCISPYNFSFFVSSFSLDNAFSFLVSLFFALSNEAIESLILLILFFGSFNYSL